MSQLGVEGLRAERDSILAIAKSLSDDEWNAPSDCDGWAVRDVVAHMGSVIHGVVDPSKMVDLTAGIFLFDGYCHLRNDILKPNGPIDRPEPPRDEQRLRPTLEWMLAGLPWMCASQLAFVDRPIA